MAGYDALFRLQGINNQEPREITVTPNGFMIGRSGDNDLALAHSQISRQHARIFFKDDQYWIEDLNSSNGAWVNDSRIRPSAPQIIRPGDVIRLGPFVLTYLRAITPPPPLPAAPANREELPPPKAVVVGEPQVTPPVLAEGLGESPAPVPEAPPADLSPDEESALDQAIAAFEQQEGPKSPVPVVQPVSTIPLSSSLLPSDYHTDAGGTISGNGASGGTGGREATEESYPVGIPRYRSSWLQYLPAIYSDDEFLGRYLLIYESILSPIIWMIDNFDLYLSPEVAPSEWLRWMASWFDLLIIPDLPIERQRAIMGQIGWLFLRRGTRAGLERLLELYFGVRPEILENRDEPCHFVVRLPLSQSDNRIGREIAERLIASHKPAFASHTLEIT
ncbi:MAG: FHA domain-containing protein [Anaerolineae bacterium]